MTTRTMYMHTLDGKPAKYTGDQIAFASHGRYARKGIPLAASLDQIKRERKASDKWRRSQGFKTDIFTYSYVLVEVPT